MINTILTWLVERILTYLLARAAAAVAEEKWNAEFEEINEANAKKYEEATTREERIKAAIDLLNSNKP